MKYSFILLFLLLTHAARAQQLSRQTLTQQLQKTDSTGLSGQADSLKIDSILVHYPANHLISLDFLTYDKASSLHNNKNVIILQFAYAQKNKQKQVLWNKVSTAFTDAYSSFSQHILTNAKDPVLYIDNEKIHHTETRKRIKNLTPKNIYYIHYDTQPVSAELYGQNAKNGLAGIWTR